MTNRTVADNRQDGLVVFDRVLKATSLLYFREALRAQQYEDCAELVRTAQSFGAQPKEIIRVIAGVIGAESGGPNEANRKGITRRRF